MKIITLILFVFTCRFSSCVEPGGNTGTGSGRSATGGRPTPTPNVNRPTGLPPPQGAGGSAGSNVSRGGTSQLGSTSGGITGSPAQSRPSQGSAAPSTRPGQTSGTTASTIPRIGATPSRGLTTTTPSTPLLRSGATQDSATGGSKLGTSLGHTPGTSARPGLSTGTTAPGLRSVQQGTQPTSGTQLMKLGPSTGNTVTPGPGLGNTLANRNLQGLSNDNVQRPSSQLPSRLSQGSTLGSGLGQKSTTSSLSTSPIPRFGHTQQTSTTLFNKPGQISGAGAIPSTPRIGDTPSRGHTTGNTPLLQSSSSLGPKKTPISTVASSLGATPSRPSLTSGTPTTHTKPGLTGDSSKGPLSTQGTSTITPSKTKPGQGSGTNEPSKTVDLSTLEPEDLGEDLEADLQPTRV